MIVRNGTTNLTIDRAKSTRYQQVVADLYSRVFRNGVVVTKTKTRTKERFTKHFFGNNGTRVSTLSPLPNTHAARKCFCRFFLLLKRNRRSFDAHASIYIRIYGMAAVPRRSDVRLYPPRVVINFFFPVVSTTTERTFSDRRRSRYFRASRVRDFTARTPFSYEVVFTARNAHLYSNRLGLRLQ